MSGLCRCPQVSILTGSIVANIKTSIRIHTCTHTHTDNYNIECFEWRKRLAEGQSPLSASVSPPLVNVLLGNRLWIV